MTWSRELLINCLYKRKRRTCSQIFFDLPQQHHYLDSSQNCCYRKYVLPITTFQMHFFFQQNESSFFPSALWFRAEIFSHSWKIFQRKRREKSMILQLTRTHNAHDFFHALSSHFPILMKMFCIREASEMPLHVALQLVFLTSWQKKTRKNYYFLLLHLTLHMAIVP